MKTVKLILIVICCLGATFSHASSADSLQKKQHFELSFGQSLLFISNSRQVNIHQQAAIVIPTSAILFLAEFRPQKVMRIPVFLNIATESKQFLVNGALVNERASPTLGSGLLFRAFKIKIDTTSRIEFECGALAGAFLDNNNKLLVSPILAGRFRICRGENFVMYLGTSYSVGINALGLLYGTGTIF